MLINEIFSSIDGEGRRAGELATFVRTVGCNLRCSYCDSKYTWGSESTNREMTVEEIVNECKELGNRNVTFTGGEPLIQKDADDLIKALYKNGFNVSIETDGAVDFTSKDWFKNRGYMVEKGEPWVCVDFKCPSSGMTPKMLDLNKFSSLRPFDVIKFVVGSDKDLDVAYEVMKEVRKKCDCYFYLSPVFGAIEPKKIVEFMQLHNLQHKTRVQLQLHKFIWDPNERGV